MPFEQAYLTSDERAKYLNTIYRNHAVIPMLKDALKSPFLGKTALVSSFGAESVVLLHMISVVAPETPVLFIDTMMLFPETLAYQVEVSEKLGLSNVIIVKADQSQIEQLDPKHDLHKTNANACCDLRKTVPLQNALNGYDAWITGRKRFQSEGRSTLPLFEAETTRRLKVNPLAKWRADDVQDYIINNNLPRHPLVAKGYPSIGCAPCTSPVKAGEDARSGRWKNSEKTECGIHFGPNGVIRGTST